MLEVEFEVLFVVVLAGFVLFVDDELFVVGVCYLKHCSFIMDCWKVVAVPSREVPLQGVHAT